MRHGLREFGAITAAALLLVVGAWAVGAPGRGPVPIPAAGLAPTPPMGWNSYDAYCGGVTEQQVRANADYMAGHMLNLGWQYVVIDYYWYFSQTFPNRDQEKWEYNMDEYGRLIPAPNRFPSSLNGQGFKPLADYIHSKGMKFGIHIMRGIPRAAVAKNLPILGTSAHAKDIVDEANPCPWSTAMYGVDATKPAGQTYYDSIVALYAKWGVDYIKADDMSWAANLAPDHYHAPEIAALHRAIMKSGRPIVLSLSPGPTPVDEVVHLRENANLWRISGDFWDNWKSLKEQFALCRAWAPYIEANHWPDADMLPLGNVRVSGYIDPERVSRFTPAEIRTHLSLWMIFRSPLMMGGELTTLDAATLAELTNTEVLAVDQHSSHNRELFTRDDQVAWAADSPAGDKYLAVFNLNDDASAEVSVTWKDLGLSGKCAVRDLWEKRDVGVFDNTFAPSIEPHGAGLFRVSPQK